MFYVNVNGRSVGHRGTHAEAVELAHAWLSGSRHLYTPVVYIYDDRNMVREYIGGVQS